MKYDPKKATQCLQAGDYAATIEKAEETVSKSSGAEMIVLHILVYDGNRALIIKEHIVEQTLWKLKSIAKAIGQLEAFSTGEFNPADYVGRNLTVELTVEEDDKYGDKNVIKKAKPLAHPVPKSERHETVAATADDVPF